MRENMDGYFWENIDKIKGCHKKKWKTGINIIKKPQKITI
jgi:hypothetical protein